MTELLPCAFCGSDDIGISDELPHHPYIECKKCYIEVSYSDCLNSAINLWNNRHVPLQNYDPLCTNELIKCQKAYNDLQEKYEKLISPWISVNTQLPQECEDILICNDEKKVSFGVYYGNIGFLMTNGEHYQDHGNVTYWKPLPEPPKVKQS